MEIGDLTFSFLFILFFSFLSTTVHFCSDEPACPHLCLHACFLMFRVHRFRGEIGLTTFDAVVKWPKTHQEKAHVTDPFLSLSSSQFLYFCFSRLQHLLQSQSQSLQDVLLSVSILFLLTSLHLPVVMAPACIANSFPAACHCCVYIYPSGAATYSSSVSVKVFGGTVLSLKINQHINALRVHWDMSRCVDVSTLRPLHSCCRSDVHVLRAIHRRFIDSSAWKVFKRARVRSHVYLTYVWIYWQLERACHQPVGKEDSGHAFLFTCFLHIINLLNQSSAVCAFTLFKFILELLPLTLVW